MGTVIMYDKKEMLNNGMTIVVAYFKINHKIITM